MDAHFNEYLAAVAGMAEVYGTSHDDASHDDAHVPEGQPVVAAS